MTLRRLWVGLVVLVLWPAVSWAQTCASINIRAVTWTFNTAYPCGQFTNGDWWVHNSGGSVTITGITPAYTVVSGWAINGSMVNPTPRTSVGAALGGEFQNGFDARTTQHSGGGITYNAGLNVATSFPLVLPASRSLLSAQSYQGATILTKPGNTHSPFILSIEILTVLAAAPAADAFRPPYVGSDKTIDPDWVWSNVDLGKLHNRPRPATTPTIAMLNTYAVEPQIELHLGWKGRYIHPWNSYQQAGCQNSNANYGQAIACTYGAMLTAVNLDFTNAEKTPMVKRLIQMGIDIYGAAINVGGVAAHGVIWSDGGAHNPGRKMPMLFAGYMLDDAPIIARANYANFKIFAEDAYHFYVQQADINLTHTFISETCGTPINYSQDDLGKPEWGNHHIPEPWEDSDSLGSCYRWVENTLIGHFLAARMMGITHLWNHPAAFDYFEDRWFPLSGYAAIAGQDANGTCTGNNMCVWLRDAWIAYKDVAPPAGGTPPADALPVISITSPTTSSSFDVSNATTTQTVSGPASDDNTLPAMSVTWMNALTADSGTATGTTSWSVANIPVSVGSNLITITVEDDAMQTVTDQITIVRAAAAGTPVDSFDRSDSSSLGSNWTCPTTDKLGIAANKASATGATGRHFCWWAATAVAANQFSVGPIGNTPTASKIMAVGVRFSGTTSTTYSGYTCTAEGATANTTTAAKFINSTRTSLQTWTQDSTMAPLVWAPNKVLRAEITGNTLSCYIDGVLIGSVATGGELTTGRPMVGGYAIGTLNEWVAGELTGGDTTLPLVDITAPVSGLITPSSILASLTWTASDANGISSCTCTNDSEEACMVMGTTSGSGTDLTLTPGLQTFRIECEDPSGNKGSDTVLVTYQEPDPPPTPEEVQYLRLRGVTGRRR